METIRGHTSLALDLTGLQARLSNYKRIILDLGTGDGRFALRYARAFPHHFAIGVDSCRENLWEYSRAKLPNLLFVITNARSLPGELNGLISHVTINFPWGSLLASLLAGDELLLEGLTAIASGNATLDIRLNGGALSEAGVALETGAIQIAEKMRESGWEIRHPQVLDQRDLQNFPSTWAKRLAYGRDPRAVLLSGRIK